MIRDRVRQQSAAIVMLVCAMSAVAEKPRVPKPPAAAKTYAFHQTMDGVTIAAEPCETKETLPDTRVDYAGHDILVMRVIVTNDTDRWIELDEARIHLVTAANDVIQAATVEDLDRILFRMKDVGAKRVPVLGIPYHKKPVDQKITEDERDFGFQTSSVGPHSTVAGYLYYDMQHTLHPVLNHAVLELRKVKFRAETGYLDSFEIALSKPEPEAAK